MKTFFNGSFAVAALCAVLVACGGSGNNPPTVLPASVAIANDARAEAGTAATFRTDLATTAGLTFRWDFGDGSGGTGPTASHAYAKPGTYSVTVAVANQAEDLRTAASTIEVGAYANVAGLDCSQADSGGWCWQHALVTGHQVNDVFFVDATHAWAVGDNRTILKSTDAGTTWAQVAVDPTLAPASLRSVRFYDAAHGMALDDQGGALRTADGGNTWTPVSFSSLIYGGPTTFVSFGASRVIVQSAYGGGAMSIDGGSTWTSVAASPPIQATSTDCWSFTSYVVQRAAGCGPVTTTALSPFISNGYMYFATGAVASDSQAIVIGSGYSWSTSTDVAVGWATADGGTTWTPFTPSGLPSYFYAVMTLHMADPQTGMLYSPTDLTAYATADGGLDWTAITPSPALTQPVSGYRATGYVGNGVLWQSAANRVSLSTDRGASWHDATVHAEDAAAQAGLTGAAAVTQYTDANDFVVAISHRFYVTQDGGQSFRQMLGGDSRDAGSQYAAGEFSDIRHGTFLTSNGGLLSTADGGRTWTRQDYANAAGGPVALHFTSATEGWLLLGGKLAHSTDGGASWSTPLTNFDMVNLTGMSWGDATHGWTWNWGQLFYTLDAGATWTKATLPVNVTANSATMTGALTGVIGSYYGGGATTQDGGVTWQAVPTNVYLGRLVHTRGGTVWSLNGQSLTRSKDGGSTWQSAGPSVYNTSFTGIAFADDLHGWLVGTNGMLLRTIDGGDSWSAQPVGADLMLLGVVAVDPMTAWIITRDGQVLATATAGN